MNKVPLMVVLSFLFLLGMTPSFGQGDVPFSQIERQAKMRAQAYAQEIQHINKAVMHSKQSAKMTQYTSKLTQRLSHSESMNTHLKKVSHVVVFLSFSIPEKSLEAWLTQCKISGATPVIRGLINNSFKETMRAIEVLSNKVGIGMQLDPILFKTFGIRQVPAVVFAKEIPECPANTDCKPIDYDVIYGDVSLYYALEQLNEAHSLEDARLTGMMSRLGGGVR